MYALPSDSAATMVIVRKSYKNPIDKSLTNQMPEAFVKTDPN